MSNLSSFLLAARPKTLSASVIPVWAGCMVVAKMGSALNWGMAVWTVLSALCLQIACNLFNDAIDHQKKADTAQRQGPKRMTATGALSRSQVLSGAGAFLILACSFAWPLYELRGWPILAIGIPSLFFCYGYTGGPFPLAYKGLGEIFVILFFGLVAVLGTIFVQMGVPSETDAMNYIHVVGIYNAGVVIGIQCGLLSAVMISINNIRDRKEDEKTGKRTLAVRIGDSRARGMTIGFIAAAYITLPTAFRALGISIAGIWWMWLPSVLLAGYLIFKIRKTPADHRFNQLLALASINLIIYLATYTFC